MTYYVLELENIQNEKPEVVEYLKDGVFSVNGTRKPFSRVAVDMTSEQTINGEAKNRLKGTMRLQILIRLLIDSKLLAA